jgi:3-(methylthio)propanoyl-CoA dehydrogenase
MAGNFFLDNDDLLFQFSQIKWDGLLAYSENKQENPDFDIQESISFYKELLVSMGEYISEEIAPHTKELDEQHPEMTADGEVKDPPRMEKIMKGLFEMGAMSISHSARFGGMDAPYLVNNILLEMLARADVSVMSHFGFHGGIAQALMLYSIEEGSAKVEGHRLVATRFDEQIKKIVQEGEWGAMVLTEPGAGSDLSRIRAKSILQDDGSWRLTGQKIYITSGHGEHHVVLARTEDEEKKPGLKGLSLFYVPAHLEKDGEKVRNCVIGGIEKKMGQHSAVAATIHYENSYAELIGQRGHGFLGMLLLMNNARIAVGFESLGLMETAYRMAQNFAEERVSMGKPIARHEMIADYLEEIDVTMRGLRAITFKASLHEETASRMSGYLKLHPDLPDDERKEIEKNRRYHRKKARELTPLIKYVGGEGAVYAARMNMQILGGLGYICETGAEKLLRDALVIPVYEGTSQIQSLMALKDILQAAMRNPGRYLGEMASVRLESMSARDPMEKLLAKVRVTSLSAIQTIMTNIAADKIGDMKGKPVAEWRTAVMKDWDPSRDFRYGLLHAERLTRILSWEAMGRQLVKNARKSADSKEGPHRREIAISFLERFEPRARGMLDEIEATSGFFQRVMKKKIPNLTEEP